MIGNAVCGSIPFQALHDARPTGKVRLVQDGNGDWFVEEQVLAPNLPTFWRDTHTGRYNDRLLAEYEAKQLKARHDRDAKRHQRLQEIEL